MYKHQQFVGKGVKQLRAEKEAIVDQVRERERECARARVRERACLVVVEMGVRWASLA